MVLLNRQTLSSIQSKQSIQLPAQNVWQLPEKALQFGTGVLLRGLPDYYINKANNAGIFKGRIVVVKSTQNKKDKSDAFAKQDCLYTHCIKGIEDNETVETFIINAAISRVINANNNWQTVLQCAHNPQLQIIISNTTEVGISLLENDDIHSSPPQSFPGKLLAFLYERYKAFEGSDESGMVIIPTELIVDSGSKLKAIALELARLNQLDKSFIKWVENANDWCSSLVDRIVPGALPEKDKQQLEQTFGYSDELAIISEPYNLWAIESESERTQQILSFSEADKNVIITYNIQKYRELKLRLLNATHTLSCGLAYLCNFNVVNEAMQNKNFHQFVSNLLYHEIIPCIISNDITKEEAEAFAAHVISRFANTFIQHQWLAITLQFTSKIKSRCVPLISTFYQRSSSSESCMALGFAAYLLFMKITQIKGDKYYGERNRETYAIQDDEAKRFYNLWQEENAESVVSQALADAELWGEDLALMPHFKSEVTKYLQQLLSGKNLMELLSSITGIK